MVSSRQSFYGLDVFFSRENPVISMDFLQCCSARHKERSERGEYTKQKEYASPGQTIPTKVPPGLESGSPQAPNLGGVGIIFQAQSRVRKANDTGLIVASLALDGPAEKSGQVMVGDILVKINDVDIRNISAENLAPLILGPPGSKVGLGFIRGSQYRTVELTRGWTLKRTEQWSNPLPANHSLPGGMPPHS
jgi:C-terminal processing protease CtpA/Prc